MVNVHAPGTAAIRSRVADVEHRAAVALYANPDSWAVAVVEPSTGLILAWDGWYYEAIDPGSITGLEDLDWDDWDDAPSKLLARSNAFWLGELLGYWLAPKYSLAQSAADVILFHGAARDHATDQRNFRATTLVAYLPVVDEQVLMDCVLRYSQETPALVPEDLVAALEKVLAH